MIWEYLGEYLSNAERYDEAIDAFRRAQSLPNASQAAAELNIAIVQDRQGRHEDALRILEKIPLMPKRDGDPTDWRVTSQRVSTLTRLGRPEEALSLVQKAIEGLRPDDEDRMGQALLWADFAELRWTHLNDAEGALDAAWEAVRLDKTNEMAAWVVRDVAHLLSPTARSYRVIVLGLWHLPLRAGEKALGFMTSYGVVADSAAEALEFIRPFEAPAVRESLRVQSIDDLGPKPELPKGVYWATGGYTFYTDD